MPQRPEELVELLPAADRFLTRESAVPDASQRRGLVLVHDLAGDFDAASAGTLAGAHLVREPATTPEGERKEETAR